MTAAILDVTLTLFWLSLGVSAAVVCLFLWLMREPRENPPEPRKPSSKGDERVS